MPRLSIDLEWMRRIHANGTVHLNRNPISEYAAGRLIAAGALRWADRREELHDRVALTDAGRREIGVV